MKRKVKLALIGAGGMGNIHISDMMKMPEIELAGVCDIDSSARDKSAALGLPVFKTHQELFEKASPEGVIISTPHGDHPVIAADAFAKGIHVLSEKPAGLHAVQVEDALRVWRKGQEKNPNLRYAMMFQQRTYGHWLKIKEMIDAGELGKLQRCTWLITDWFRTQIYYDGGGWRATWKGEGGGVLLNQSPHNLDLYQWLVGAPKNVIGTASLGKYHHIEVEDEVTALFEHEDGMIGHFITSTSESPGTNRLEICGEKGKLVYEDGVLTFWKNKISSLELIRVSQKPFDSAPFEKISVEYKHHGEAGHRFVIENFAEALRDDKIKLICEGFSAVSSLKMANCIMLSSFSNGRKVEIEKEFPAWKVKLESLAAESKFEKKVRKHTADLSNSF